MLAFGVQSSGDANKKISFVTTVLLNMFARAHPLESELPYAVQYFSNLIYIRLNVFLEK